MGTGIVSIGFYLTQHVLLSRILFAIDGVLWLGLIAVFALRRLVRPERWFQEARTPGALTAVAGTAVLGSRLAFAGTEWAAWLLLAIAFAAWLRFVPTVLRYWQTPTVGVSFVLTVATESLAVLAALIAGREQRPWLAAAALVPVVLGLAFYLFVLSHIDLRQVATGHGDHWVYGGALAIATLACSDTTTALAGTSTLTGLHGTLEDATLALWAAAMLWLPVLLAGELIRPRLRYDTRRWSTVFPFGMYAVCSIAAGGVTGVGGIADFGHAWIWVALAVWGVVFAGMLRHARPTLDTGPPGGHG